MSNSDPRRYRVLNQLSLVALGAVVLYVAILGSLWWLQERVVFQPPRGIPPHDVAARRVTYRAADGVELFAYVVGNCGGANTVMIAFHGNADIARWFVP